MTYRNPIPFISIAFICFVSASLKAQDHYTVSITDLAERRVQVKAIIHPKGDLLMSPFGAEHLEYGWATFVEDLTATSSEGVPIPINTLTGGAIEMANPNNGEPVELNYSIRLAHEKHHWPFGYKEAAYVLDGMLMATGNALFITQLEMDSAIVQFEVPADHRVATAWQTISPGTFAMKGAEELVWTVIAVGQFDPIEFRSGDVNVVIVHGKGVTPHIPNIKEITRNSIAGYGSAFGGMPRNNSTKGTTYLQVINIDSNYVGGGAAFTNSISILLNKAPEPCTEAISKCWHHILVHELGHLWNGHSLRAAESDQWFIEGFTDYLAFRLQREMKLYGDDGWEKLLEQKKKETDEARKSAEISLEEAGKDKSRYYDLIYSGGLLFADGLDQRIKEKTSGRSDLLDVMKKLYSNYAGTETLIDRTILQTAAEETCACELDDVFQELVRK
ncbi:MAG: hypothetical protein M3R08_06070 [Bacteroidota bacterium]|nr:hypothetical protein [Bacteroidota bacterium]